MERRRRECRHNTDCMLTYSKLKKPNQQQNPKNRLKASLKILHYFSANRTKDNIQKHWRGGKGFLEKYEPKRV